MKISDSIKLIRRAARRFRGAKTASARRSARVSLPFFLAGIFFFVFLASGAYAGQMAVIVNESGPLTGVTDNEIKEIYLGNMRFAGGVPLSPMNYSEGAVKDAFLNSIIGMKSREYRLYWTKKVFQEGVQVPPAIDGFQAVITNVRKNVGAIGYVPLTALTDMSGIRIVRKMDSR